MYVFYNIAVVIAGFFLKFVALFNKKIALFVEGRKFVLQQLPYEIFENDKTIWIHCASLGEFEQGRPIIEQLKKTYKSHKIVLTFFSPSGYEVQKNYTQADVICYLPLDTKSNAKKFLDIVHPDIAIFVKYEFWPNILRELRLRNINTILVSGIFRKEQAFFKSNSWMRKSLYSFSHFFVQDENSKALLNTIDFNNVAVSGDTRFDRVANITKQNNQLDFIAEFKGDNILVVIGSSWKEDEELFVKYINESQLENVKFLFAPHNIDEYETSRLQKSIQPKSVLFSTIDSSDLINANVFIADTIGILTKIYSYADIAYVGGGFATGLHNILEPATFGIPVVIGSNFDKFREAKELVNLKGCLSVKGYNELNENLSQLILNVDFRKKTGEICKKYVQQNIGATEQIITYIQHEIQE